MSPPSPSIVSSSVFVGLMCAAIWSDATSRRLPNRLTVTAVFVGLAVRAFAGPVAVLWGVGGTLAGGLLALPLFALGAIGAGDVKLAAAAGAFLGPRELVWALLLGAALSLLLVAEETTRRKVAIPVLYRTKDLLVHLLTLGRRGERPTLAAKGAVTVPYGIAIAAGAIAAWFIPSATVLR